MLFLQPIFYIIRKCSLIYAANYICKKSSKINSISYKNDEYFVTYFNPGERLIHIKSAKAIIKSEELINKFDSYDAAILGIYASNPSKKLMNKIKLL